MKRPESELSVGQWIYRVLLLAASWLFFSWNEITPLLWLLGITMFGYGLGLSIGRSRSNKRLTIIGSAAIICVLVIFKYVPITGNSLVIPLGLSYYTLMVIGYLIDVYRGDIEAEESFILFALYTGFFPQATAGPVGRSKALLNTYRRRITLTPTEIKTGLLMIGLGIFQKWVMADNLHTVVDTLIESEAGGMAVVIGFVLYSLTIYYDFAGYSMIAIGIGQLLGVRLSDNFHAPYLATSLRDFWRRWHISLSTWFRDYLYIPLGGSRVSPWRRDVNTLIVFVLSGAWHGQGSGFWMWGVLHGLYLIMENRLRSAFSIGKKGQKTGRVSNPVLSFLLHLLQRIAVFVLVTLAWVPFYAGTFERACELYAGIFVPDAEAFEAQWLNGFGMRWEWWLIIGVCVILYLLISIVQENTQYRFYTAIARHGFFVFLIGIAGYTLLLLIGAYGSQYEASTFIYGGF